MCSKYFVLQKRRGHGESRSFTSLLVNTLDSVWDTKPPPYRILHQTPTSEVYYGKFQIEVNMQLVSWVQLLYINI